MTLKEFENQQWGYGMTGEYKGDEHAIVSVNFGESLVGLVGVCQGADDNEIAWVRCEGVTVTGGIKPNGKPIR